jgi:uncharacterized protein
MGILAGLLWFSRSSLAIGHNSFNPFCVDTPRTGHYHAATGMRRDLSPRPLRAPRRFPTAARFRAFAGLLALLLFASCTVFAQATQIPAKPAGYVNDYAGVLSASTVSQLTALCTEINNKANAQIFVVTIKSTGDTPIEDYSIALATKWGVGPKASSSGVLILYAIDDRKSRVEVGYGLEGILNDGKVGTIMREAVPNMRAGDYSGAIMLVTRRVADVIAQDRGVTLTGAAPPVRQPVAQDQGGGWGAIIVLIIIVVVFFMMMKNSGGGGGRSGRGGGSGWWIGPMIGGMMGGGGGGGWSGGGGGGGFGGSFGGGGGGSFGGGGATGSW